MKKVIMLLLMLCFAGPVFAHDARSEADNLYVPVIEEKLKQCTEKASVFDIREEALATCTNDLAKSQERFFNMNKTWIKGVLSGIIMALIII